MDLDPETNTKLSIKLFTQVKNAKEIKEQLIQGEFKCSMIKPSLILDPFQIAVAANKALLNEKLTTKTVYTEILFNLSPTKNISKSLQTFGIDEKDDALLVVTLCKDTENEEADFLKQIDAVEAPIEKLSDYTDINLIKKIYKINDKESSVTPILDSIVSRIATKDFLSL
ncbi:unnamed protein product [Phyllotreta striolata]|uniref:Uncharacterized protein n=1 Tax=Phyllotreta striolata TaxID=444603 RepID=A0A9N9TRY5_PHYSR|nr:unnamed protein product [Phyllotreta striolata]